MNTVIKYYQVDPRKIVVLKSLLEGYEGLSVLRTANPEKGIIQLLISPDFVEDINIIIEELSRQLWIGEAPEQEHSVFTE